MCARCGTGNIAWCTHPTRHAEQLSEAALARQAQAALAAPLITLSEQGQRPWNLLVLTGDGEDEDSLIIRGPRSKHHSSIHVTRESLLAFAREILALLDGDATPEHASHTDRDPGCQDCSAEAGLS
jgi:hypothetical protein